VCVWLIPDIVLLCRFPWVLPFDHEPDFHDYHHENFKGNYGLLGVLDLLHGTYAVRSVKKVQTLAHPQPNPIAAPQCSHIFAVA
jgi:sterol desaturase/sphingolipid hydroxylase (fatty acid hydroxylase superfamily)